MVKFKTGDLVIAMEARDDQPCISNSYCSKELWNEWLPRLMERSNANILQKLLYI